MSSESAGRKILCTVPLLLNYVETRCNFIQCTLTIYSHGKKEIQGHCFSDSCRNTIRGRILRGPKQHEEQKPRRQTARLNLHRCCASRDRVSDTLRRDSVMAAHAASSPAPSIAASATAFAHLAATNKPPVVATAVYEASETRMGVAEVAAHLQVRSPPPTVFRGLRVV